MSEQFLFFCTNIGNEKLLKEEIKYFYPDLKISYSRKGFLTFKNQGVQYSPKTITQLMPVFATRAGLCLGKSKTSELKTNLEKLTNELNIEEDNYIIHHFSIGEGFEYPDSDLLVEDIPKYDGTKSLIINLMILGTDEIWIGLHSPNKFVKTYPNSNPNFSIPEASPSKAYLKLAETVELFKVGVNSTERWLDFGSAPGGASYFLLEKGCKVWGIDPAKPSPELEKMQNYKHITNSVQDLSQEKLPEQDIHWVHVDLNLNPKQAVKEVLRLCKKYSRSLKGILFTVQIVQIDFIREIEDYEDQFYDWGFSNIFSAQVPAHKNEFVIVAKR